MTDRDERGRLLPGHTIKSPGRPITSNRAEYLAMLRDQVTPDKWLKIVNKAIADAMRGNPIARQWLGDYIIGKPPQTLQISAAESAVLAEILERLKDQNVSAGDLFQTMLSEMSHYEQIENNT